jgi:hypothetical protein
MPLGALHHDGGESPRMRSHERLAPRAHEMQGWAIAVKMDLGARPWVSTGVQSSRPE